MINFSAPFISRYLTIEGIFDLLDPVPMNEMSIRSYSAIFCRSSLRQFHYNFIKWIITQKGMLKSVVNVSPEMLS